LLPLAYELEDSADRVHDLAERTSRHRSPFERRAVEALRELDREARDFRKVLEHRAWFARDARHAYADLREAFRDAQYAVHNLRGPRPVEREFDRLEYVMDRLDRKYDFLLAGARGPAHGHRVPVSGGDHSYGRVQIGKSWDGGHASIGFTWRD
jgi:hypothetical protein